MLFSAILNASASVEVDGLYYNLDMDNLTAEVTSPPDSKYTVENINIPSTIQVEEKEYTVVSIGEIAFFECKSLTSIKFPEFLTSIKDGAFCNCDNITEVVFPESLNLIGRYTFENCYSLTEMIFPESLVSIGVAAFRGCNLRNIYAYGFDPPTLGLNSFDLSESTKFYVRKGAIESYRNKWGVNNIEEFTAAKIEIKCDGEQIRFESESDNGNNIEIYSSFDGTEYSKTEMLELTDRDMMDKTIYIYAKEPNLNASPIMKYTPGAFYQGNTLWVSQPGKFAEVFKNREGNLSHNLKIVGKLGDKDMVILRSNDIFNSLDLSETDIIYTSISFIGLADLKHTKLPKSGTIANNIFEGCKSLASVEWNMNTRAPQSLFSDCKNPNMLFYVASKSLAPEGFENVVEKWGSGYYAESIALDGTYKIDGTDSITYHNFSPLYPFTAGKISLTRSFLQETPMNHAAGGWESITLPFAPQKYTHYINGECAPEASGCPNGERPFWLYSLGESIQKAASIEANRPYLIALPNNEDYFDDYRLDGPITFEAENVMIDVVPTSNETEGRTYSGTTVRIPANEGLYAINVGETVNGSPEGSIWVSGLRDIRPFEAYVADSKATVKIIPIFDGQTPTGLSNPNQDGELAEIRIEGLTLCISSTCGDKAVILTPDGLIVAEMRIAEGKTATCSLPQPGIYFVRIGNRIEKIFAHF